MLTTTRRPDVDAAYPRLQTKEPSASPKEILLQLVTTRAAQGADVANKYRQETASELDAALEPLATPEQRTAVRNHLESARNDLSAAFLAALTRSEDNVDSIEAHMRSTFDSVSLVRQQVLSAAGGEAEATDVYWRQRDLDWMVDSAYDLWLSEVRDEIKAGEALDMRQENIQGCVDSLRAMFGVTDTEPAEDASEARGRARMRRASALRNTAVADRLGRDEGNLARRVWDRIASELSSLGGREAWGMVKKFSGFVVALLLLGGTYMVIRTAVNPDAALRAAGEHIKEADGQMNQALSMLDSAESSALAAEAVSRDFTGELVDRGNILNSVLAAPKDSGGEALGFYKDLMLNLVGAAQSRLNDLALDPSINPEKYDELFAKAAKDVKGVSEGGFKEVFDWMSALRNASTMDDVKEVALQYDNKVEALIGVKLTDAPLADDLFRAHLSTAVATIAKSKERLTDAASELGRATDALAKGITKAQRVRSSTPVMTAVARMTSDWLGTGEAGATFLAMSLLRQATAAEAILGTFVVDLTTAAAAGSLAGVLTALATLGANLVVGYISGDLTGLLNMVLGGTVEWAAKASERMLLAARNSYDATGDGNGAISKVLDAFYFVVSGTRTTVSTLRTAQSAVGLTRMGVQLGSVFATVMFTAAVSLSQLGVMATTGVAVTAVAVSTYALFCRAQSPSLSEMIAPLLHHLDHWGQWYKRLLTAFLLLWTLRAQFTPKEWLGDGTRLTTFFKSTAPTWEDVAEAKNDPQLAAFMTAKDTMATHLSQLTTDAVTTEQLLGVNRVIAAGVELKTPGI